MKKKLISLLLAVSLLLSFTLPVHAEDSFSIDSEAAYVASVEPQRLFLLCSVSKGGIFLDRWGYGQLLHVYAV